MLDLLKKKKIKHLNKSSNGEFKHFPSSVREWNNSIYIYNKNNLNLIPFTTVYVMKIIQSFFNAYNRNLEKIIRTKRLLLRLRRLSSNRIYLSNGEFKHKNNNILINIYIFNRQKYNYLFKMKNIYLEKFLKNNFNKRYVKTLKNIYIKGLSSLKKVNKNKYLLLKTLDIVNKNYKISTLKSLSNYVLYFYKKVLNLTMKRLRLYFLYKQLIYINKSKLNYTYLRLLKKYIEYLYNKNVEFNLINIKRFYLNSDILSESVKLKITRNKNKIHNILKRMKNKIHICKKNPFLDYKKSTYCNANTLKKVKNTNILKCIILNNLKFKHITGFRLQATGRLSKRYTASRSVSKLQYKGNLLNIDSSYNGISSVILKGNLKPNIQYTKLRSKTRIGSFGIKGWVSSN